MCIDPTAEDFTMIHHELGHNFYQRAYKDLPVLFRDSANDGFHEALGDTIALSVTPEYLVKVGLIATGARRVGRHRAAAAAGAGEDRVPAVRPAGRSMALAGVLGTGDAGELQPGVVGACGRSTRASRRRSRAARRSSIRARSITCRATRPYARYFLAHILQFQFHRALSQAAGCTAPLHRCSIYESKAAGERLNKMMAMGLSTPWPEALEALTGSKQMDATAIIDYFAPLQAWLDEQIKGKPVGW